MSTASWYKTGFGDIDGPDGEDMTSGKLWRPNRFWIKPGGQTDVIFVDASPARVYEHQLRIDGSYKNWFTCLRGVEGESSCPMCEGDEETRAHVGLLTIVDGSQWTDKKGHVHKYELKLIAGKSITRKLWERRHESCKEKGHPGGLAGSLFRVNRDGDKTPGCGSDFEFLRVVDPNGLFKETSYSNQKLSVLYDNAEKNEKDMEALKRIFNLQFDENKKIVRKIHPFNYFELLRPLSSKLLVKRLANWKPTPGTGVVDKDEEVPF